jgi:hypothetical protein
MRSAHELETAGLGVHSVALPGAEARPASDALVRRRKAAHAAPLARSAVLRRSHGRIRVHHLRLLRWSAIYARHAQSFTLFIPVKGLVGSSPRPCMLQNDTHRMPQSCAVQKQAELALPCVADMTTTHFNSCSPMCISCPLGVSACQFFNAGRWCTGVSSHFQEACKGDGPPTLCFEHGSRLALWALLLLPALLRCRHSELQLCTLA